MGNRVIKLNYVEQAKALQGMLSGMRYYIGKHEKDFTESEVSFRYKTLKNMLIIFKNDVDELVRMWKKDYEIEEKSLPSGEGVR